MSLLLWSGEDLAYVADQAGHSIATLARHYAGVIRELKGQPRIPAADQVRRAREMACGQLSLGSDGEHRSLHGEAALDVPRVWARIIVCANGYLDAEPTGEGMFGVTQLGPFFMMASPAAGEGGSRHDAHEHQPGTSE